jgi:radical SAM protein with 4Fe4S-binding SPASM domain
MSTPRPDYARRVRRDEAELWKGARPLLTWLDLELTERCNNACVHCSVNLPVADPGARRRELGTAEIGSLLESAAGLGCLTVRLTGGEPLVRDDFAEIYLMARKLGLRVMLFTNATLITPALADLFAQVPPRETIEVSVYGLERASHDAVTRAPGSFDAARRGLGLLVDRRIPFFIKSALLPANAAEKDRFERWACGLSGQSQAAWATFFDLRSRRDEGKNELIRSLRPAPDEIRRRTAGLPAAARDELLRFIAGHAAVQGDRLFGCLGAGGKGAVDAYGKFQYCLLLRHPDTVFDLETGTLRSALTAHLAAVRAKKARNPEYLGRCGRCFLKSFCLQCPAKSWAEHGTLDTPVEYLCEITHAQAVGLGVLADGEKAWTIVDRDRRIARVVDAGDGGRRLPRECPQ